MTTPVPTRKIFARGRKLVPVHSVWLVAHFQHCWMSTCKFSS